MIRPGDDERSRRSRHGAAPALTLPIGLATPRDEAMRVPKKPLQADGLARVRGLNGG